MAEKRRRVDSLEKRRERAAAIAPRLAEAYPDLEISLDWETPLELVVATILSAQCTDERVNQTTPALFERYRTARDYAEADREELEELIRSTGFFRNKAKNIQGMGRVVAEEFGGEVPDTMDELLTLPGVARKTANVVLTNGFGKVEGIVVDTHIKRVSRRLGLTGETSPVKIERDLMKVLPEDQWHPFPWRLILHGRAVCDARSPRCDDCMLSDLCPSAFSFDS
ncbi:MAG TPA: endonuclease III [Gemmatimonadota bacterium]|nr:endonuclease III [Gemmatimonadota bacterium]